MYPFFKNVFTHIKLKLALAKNTSTHTNYHYNVQKIKFKLQIIPQTCLNVVVVSTSVAVLNYYEMLQLNLYFFVSQLVTDCG